MTNTLARYRPQKVNANKHTPRGLRELRTSVGKYGIGDGITVAADGESLSGSARLETLAEIMPDVKIQEVETWGETLLVNKRMDIPTADDPKGQALSAAVNIVQRIDYDPDGAILAMLANDDEAIKQMIAADDASLKAIMLFSNNGDFAPVGIDEQPRLDQKKAVTCPHCGAVFNPE